jgi:hypothetical protein
MNTLELDQAAMRARQAKAKTQPKLKPEPLFAAPEYVAAGVYLVGSSTNGWYKIGHSTDVPTRVKSYRSLPFILDVQRMWNIGASSAKKERELHQIFKSVQININNAAHTEWFALTHEDIALLDRLMSEYPAIVMPLPPTIDHAGYDLIHSISI